MKDNKSTSEKAFLDFTEENHEKLINGELTLSDFSPEDQDKMLGITSEEPVQFESDEKVEPSKSTEANEGEPSKAVETPTEEKKTVDVPADDDKPKTLAEKYYRKSNEANTFRQKLESKERHLTRMAEDAEYAKKWLSENAKWSKDVEVPVALDGSLDIEKAPAAIKAIYEKSQRLEREMEEMRQDQQRKMADLERQEEIRAVQHDLEAFGIDLGEKFDEAERKYASAWAKLNGDENAIDRYVKDENYRKSVGDAPKNLDGLLKVLQAVHDCKALGGKYPLAVFLREQGLEPKKAQTKQATAHDDVRKAEINKMAEVSQRPEPMPTSSGSPREVDSDADFIEKMDKKPSELWTAEERKRLNKIVESMSNG